MQNELPGYAGFSRRNLWDMRRFYESYKDHPKLRQLVAEIPWGHHLLLLNKITNLEECLNYVEATRKMSWSRNILLNQIKAKAYKRHRQLPWQHNFKKSLPAHLHEQADEILKSSEYELRKTFPKKLQKQLPTAPARRSLKRERQN